MITGVTVASVTLFPAQAQATLDDLTIVRTRGEILVFLSASIGALEGFRWGMGMCVVTDQAGSAGVASVPRPLADMDWDGWFVHEQGTLRQAQAVTTIESAANSGSSFARIRIDSKAMRKTHLSDRTIAVLEVDTEVGAANFEADMTTRILAKLA